MKTTITTFGMLCLAFTGPAVADTANTAAVVTAANTFMAPLTTTQKTAITATSSNTNTSCLYNGPGTASGLANVGIWSNLPTSNVTRNGLRYANMSATDQANGLLVADAALSAQGRKLLDDIRASDRFIAGETTRISPTTGSPNSSMWGFGKYFIAFVGAPSTSSAWTFQFGGHHLAYNITYNGTYTSGTPIFAATEPNVFTDNTGSYYPLQNQRVAIVALRSGGTYTPVYPRIDGGSGAVTVTAITTSALLSGTFSDVVMGPNGTGSHDTVFPKSYPTSGRGQLYSALTAAQKVVVVDYIKSWITNLHSSISDELLAIYLSPQALAETYIGYAGSSATLASSANYFRVDGPRHWAEFSVQGGVFNGGSVHDHAVVRDKLADYGGGIYSSTTISTTVRPPVITTQPVSASVTTGGSATFSVVAANAGTGTATLSFQWYKGSAAISGATGSSYTVSPAAAADAADYSVKVISTGGLVTSSAATLSIVSADSDNDGMTDTYETANGLTVGTDDSASDLDGDGQTNLAEFIAGTAANNAASNLAITSVSTGSNTLSVTWSAVSGKTYLIQTSTDLTAGSWTTLTTGITATAEGTLTRSVNTSGNRLFVRVKVSQ